MSEPGDEKGMASEVTPPHSSVGCSSSPRSAPCESSHSGSSNPGTPGHQISHVASTTSSHIFPVLQFCDASPASGSKWHSLFVHYSQSVVSPAKLSPKVTVEKADDALIRYQKQLQECDKGIPKDIVSQRIFRAEALVELGRVREAFDEFLKAQTLEPENCELHHRICQLYIRTGNVVLAEEHVDQSCQEYKKILFAKIEDVKGHLLRAERARHDGDWTLSLVEAEATISAGAEISPMAIALRAEMELKMDRLDQAERAISKAVKLAQELPFTLKFDGMELEAYAHAVLAQIEMALGKFKNAIEEADKAYAKDKSNAEISAIRKNVMMANAACNKGNEHYKKGAYLQAYDEYKDGLQYAKSNVNLLIGMAACDIEFKRWKQCIEICSGILRILPSHKKSLEGRAYSYGKLKKWAESVMDYDAARKVDPDDTKLIKAQLRAQVKLAEPIAEKVSCLEDRRPVIIVITTIEEFKEAMSLLGTIIAFFHDNTDPQCIKITPCVDKLCFCCHPWINFLLVDIIECPSIANAVNICHVPTLVIYKEGKKMDEIYNPTDKMLIKWVEDYIVSDWSI